MAQRDFYEILGLARDASPEDVKRAFRRLAHKHHPDVNPDDPQAEARFKEIAEAYSVLSDPDKRAQYDQYGRVGAGQMPTGDAWDNFGISDIFDAFFGGIGGAPRSRGPQRGSDLRYDLEVTLEEVATGVEKVLQVERVRPCDVCQGRGTRTEAPPRSCPTCRGAGQVRQARSTPFGRITTVNTCPKCGGQGVEITDPCPTCRGGGRRAQHAELRAQIPAGIEDGGMIRLDGEGEAGERGAPTGDLYVVAHVAPHPTFTRRGRDLHCQASLSFTLAALGGTLHVPTLEGEDELLIPAGTQTGDTFTLRGRGLPDVRTGLRGSELVTVQLVTPRHLNERQKELLAEFAREGGEEFDEPKGWFQRIREAIRGEDEE